MNYDMAQNVHQRFPYKTLCRSLLNGDGHAKRGVQCAHIYLLNCTSPHCIWSAIKVRTNRDESENHMKRKCIKMP